MTFEIGITIIYDIFIKTGLIENLHNKFLAYRLMVVYKENQDYDRFYVIYS